MDLDEIVRRLGGRQREPVIFLSEDIAELYARVDMLELKTNDTKCIDDEWADFGSVEEPYSYRP